MKRNPPIRPNFSGTARASLALFCDRFRRAACRALAPILLLGPVIGYVDFASGQGSAIARPLFLANLDNIDVRYPNSLPNDIELVYYAPGIRTNDVTFTWDSNNRVGTNPGIGWGTASSITSGITYDTNSPAYGLDCITVRYQGPPRPALVGDMVHFGVALRPGAVTAHKEVWWTINGQRILRPCDPHIQWICSTNGWLICVQNPNSIPIYVYGSRYFAPAATVSLPPLDQLNFAIDPVNYGASGWTPLPLPGGQRVVCIPAWCRIYLRVPVISWRPIVFQLASRNVPESVLPLPPGTVGPNPDDWNGEQGTMAILSTRATEEFPEDITGEGVVGIPDFNLLRSRFGARSSDLPSPALLKGTSDAAQEQ